MTKMRRHRRHLTLTVTLSTRNIVDEKDKTEMYFKKKNFTKMVRRTRSSLHQQFYRKRVKVNNEN